MRLIDRPTVEKLQGKAPGAFQKDHDDLIGELKSGHIFGNFSESQKAELWSRVCAASRDHLIPSLFTFFEDRKFLNSAADCIKRIAHVGPKNTVTSRLVRMFTDARQESNQCIVQVSDTAYTIIPGNPATRFDVGCRTLWLLGFREFKELPPDTKKEVLAKARKKADETTLFELASLASKVGFESKEIREIMNTSPDRDVAKRALLAARKPGRYQYHNFEHCIQQMVKIFSTASPIVVTDMSQNPELSQCVGPPIRSGIPHDADHDRDRAQLFLPQMHQQFEAIQTRMTSFFIRKSVYLAYFGQCPSIRNDIADGQHSPYFDLRTGLKLTASVNGGLPISTVNREENEQIEEMELAQVDTCEEMAGLAYQTGDLTQLPLPKGKGAVSMQRAGSRIATNSGPNKTKGVTSKKQDRGRGNKVLTSRINAKDDAMRAEQNRLSRLASMDLDEPDLPYTEMTSQQTPDMMPSLSSTTTAMLSALHDIGADGTTLPTGSKDQTELATEGESDQSVCIVRQPASEPATPGEADAPWQLTPEASGSRGAETQIVSQRTRRRTQFDFQELVAHNPNKEHEAATAAKSGANGSERGRTIRIDFVNVESESGDKFVISDTVRVDPADPSPVERLAKSYRRKNFHLFDKERNPLNPMDCFHKVVEDGSYTIVLQRQPQDGGRLEQVDSGRPKK